MSAPRYLSPRALAEAVGVSESSIKRWADDGRVATARTSGGHRRIPLAEAVRFVRESQLELVRPERLGLPLPLGNGAGPLSPLEALRDALLEGRPEDARSLGAALFAQGTGLGTLCDGPLSAGEPARRSASPNDAFRRRRAASLSLALLHHLRSLLPAFPEAAPTAIVAGVAAQRPGEARSDVLACARAAAVVAGAGFRTVELGPDVPLAVLLAALAAERPRLLWVGCAAGDAPGDPADALRRGLLGARDAGTRVVLGGSPRAIDDGALPTGFAPARSYGELEALARRLGGADGPGARAAAAS